MKCRKLFPEADIMTKRIIQKIYDCYYILYY